MRDAGDIRMNAFGRGYHQNCSVAELIIWFFIIEREVWKTVSVRGSGLPLFKSIMCDNTVGNQLFENSKIRSVRGV